MDKNAKIRPSGLALIPFLVACDESALTNNQPDAEKIALITYDPVSHVYRPLGTPLAWAFKIGLA